MSAAAITVVKVRLDADPGDTSNVATTVDWRREARRYNEMALVAMRAAFADSTVLVGLNDVSEDRVWVYDGVGLLDSTAPVYERVREVIGLTWMRWVESLPGKEVAQ